MLNNTTMYRLVSIIAVISLFAVTEIVIGSTESVISPALIHSAKENGKLHISALVVSGQTEPAPVNTHNRAENSMFAGGPGPNMVKEQDKAEPAEHITKKPSQEIKRIPVKKASFTAGNSPLVKAGVAAKTEKTEGATIVLRSGRHEEYTRVVLEGPHEIISAGAVRQRDNVVSVTFSDAHFSLKENKSAVPFRREQNRILFTQFNLDKIRTHNLLKPSRLAIDFYIHKAGPDQQKASRAEKRKDIKSEMILTGKVTAADKGRPVSPNMKQNKEAQKQEILASKHASVVNVKTPVSFIHPGVSAGDSVNDSEGEVIKQAEQEVFQTVSKKEIKKTGNKKGEDPAEEVDAYVTLHAPAVLMVSNEAAAERSLQHLGTVLPADVKKETVPVEINNVMDTPALQSAPDNASSEVQIQEGKRKIALLPFDNLSNNNDAPGSIMPSIMVQLEDRGYDVLGYEEVDAYLCERRIRQSSYLSGEVAKELGKNKMVDMVMAGAVLTFASEGNPKVGIVARLMDITTGQIIWSDFVSLTGEDFTRVLGLGTITSVDQLVPRALNRLFEDFGSNSPVPAGKENYKIAVLPFKNQSEQRHAGTIITHLFQNELANNPMFDPVDFGDIKQTIVHLRIGHKGEIDYHNLQALSKSLGVDIVLTGTVEEYRPGKSYASPPSVTISARLLDSRRNRILWYDNLHLDGEENIIALDWGRLRSADKVAYGAVSGLVENMGIKGLHQ